MDRKVRRIERKFWVLIGCQVIQVDRSCRQLEIWDQRLVGDEGKNVIWGFINLEMLVELGSRWTSKKWIKRKKNAGRKSKRSGCGRKDEKDPGKNDEKLRGELENLQFGEIFEEIIFLIEIELRGKGERDWGSNFIGYLK